MIGRVRVRAVSTFSKSILKECPDVTSPGEKKCEEKVLLVFYDEDDYVIGAVTLEYFGFDIPKNSVKPLWDIYILSFEVCKKFRGYGNGKKMLQWIENNLPVSKIMLNHRGKEVDNYASRNFWKHMGFKVTDPYFHNMEKQIKR